MKFLYTHINQQVQGDRVLFLVRGRKRSSARVQVIFYGFWPRFFAKDSDIKKHRAELDMNYKVVKIIKWKGQNHPIYPDITEGLYGEPVSLILVRIPKDVRNSHGKFAGDGICNTILKDCETYQSDILVEYVFLIWSGVKSGIEIPDKPDKYILGYPAYHWKKIKPFDDFDTKTVVGTVDIENDYFRGMDPSVENAKLKITAVSLYQFDTTTMNQNVYNPVNPVSKYFKTKLNGAKAAQYDWYIRMHNDEKKMLSQFITDFSKLDLDVCTAWNSDYDYPYILKRCENLDFEAKDIYKLSPWKNIYEPVEMRGKSLMIKGRTVMDEADVYYKHTMFEGQKHSYKLNACAKEELGVGKVELKNDAGKYLSTGQILRYNFPTFLRYNAVDSELVALIDKVKGLWKFKEFQRRRMGVPIETTPRVSAALHVLFTREAMMRGMAFPNRHDAQPYKGAKVYPASPGLKKGVVTFDFKSLYASIIVMWNFSLETIIRNSLDQPRSYLKKCIQTPNGLYFKPKSEQVGFITTIVQGMMIDRDKFKQEYLIALEKLGKDDKSVEGLNMRQLYEKANINSIYGVFVYYSYLISEAIIAIEWEAIDYAKMLLTSKELFEAISKKFGEFRTIVFLYGDTDSQFVDGLDPTNELMMEFVGAWVSDHMWGLCDKYNIKENLFVLRAEESWESFFMLDRQKAYCGKQIRQYKETVGGGKWKVVDIFEMVGFEKSDISEVGNKGFKKMMEQICLSVKHPEIDLYKYIGDLLRSLKRQIARLDMDIHDLCPTTMLKRPMNTYGKVTKSGKLGGVPIHVTSAKFSNEHLGATFLPGDKIPYIYIEPKDGVKAIAVPEDWTVDDIRQAGYEIDTGTMFVKQITHKFKPVLDLLGYNLKDIIKGYKQERIEDLK